MQRSINKRILWKDLLNYVVSLLVRLRKVHICVCRFDKTSFVTVIMYSLLSNYYSHHQFSYLRVQSDWSKNRTHGVNYPYNGIPSIKLEKTWSRTNKSIIVKYSNNSFNSLSHVYYVIFVTNRISFENVQNNDILNTKVTLF